MLERHVAEISASLAKVPAPLVRRPPIRERAPGKAGDGNTTGNERLLLLPVVDGVVKVG